MGSVASLFAGLATGLGAAVILGLRAPSEGQQKTLLAFAAGVMLAASFFSLIIPALDEAQAAGASNVGAAIVVVLAILLGACALGVIRGLLPKVADHYPALLASEKSRRIWLFIAAITLHNFPEGLAVGVSFGGGDVAAGLATALGIGLQNIPEGFAVAGAALALGYKTRSAFLIGLASGLVEPIAGVTGAAAVAGAQMLLPWALGGAGGAMIYIVLAEIIPEINERSRPPRMTALMIGLAAMMFLDVALG